MKQIDKLLIKAIDNICIASGLLAPSQEPEYEYLQSQVEEEIGFAVIKIPQEVFDYHELWIADLPNGIAVCIERSPVSKTISGIKVVDFQAIIRGARIEYKMDAQHITRIVLFSVEDRDVKSDMYSSLKKTSGDKKLTLALTKEEKNSGKVYFEVIAGVTEHKKIFKVSIS